jgi:hypothetical protein
MATIEEWFWAKVDVRGPHECWPWTGFARGRPGVPYGRFRTGPDSVEQAHRVAFRLAGGEIPPGFTVDHVAARGCTTTLCCNPAHLEAVTNVENLQRGDAISQRWRKRTHCEKGHPLAEGNLTSETGRRRCRKCKNESTRERRRRARQAAPHSV